jgi:hypothetical protein
MTVPRRTFLAMLALTVIAAALAGWLGVRYGVHQVQARADIDTLLHQQIALTVAQSETIAAIEKRFNHEHRDVQAEMRAANRDLATSIGEDHVFNDRTREALARFHRAMARLQEDSIRHVLAVRSVLTPAQARQFDQIIANALTAESP